MVRLAFQVRHHAFEVVVADARTVFPVMRAPRRQRPVVNKPGMAELNGQPGLLFLVRVQAVAERFPEHQTPLWSAMYRCTVSSVTAPTVEMNLLRVQSVGSRFLSHGYSSRSSCDV